jgi:hypothetical protein
MLRNLLIERFKLSYHYEKKDAEVYDLVVAKDGPKLIASEGAERAATPPPGKMAVDASGCPVAFAAAGRRGAVSEIFHIGRLMCVAGYDAPIGELVHFLSEELGRSVNDATGLKGKYDFSFGFASDSSQSAPRAGSTSMDGGAPGVGFRAKYLRCSSGPVRTQTGEKEGLHRGLRHRPRGEGSHGELMWSDLSSPFRAEGVWGSFGSFGDRLLNPVTIELGSLGVE